ncbi:MAG TPA: helix-turn-helix domain-containing protein [Candidatus Paceibacterota bacterium]|nr:helix-turn-helix domain-containing protein [Candidatus Paceibacterota bacterium]
MDHIREFLLKFGLKQKEIDVYLACLELGGASVMTLAKRAGTKRPSTYLILEDLVKKGLVDSMKTKHGITYHPLHPKKVATQISNLQNEYAEVLPGIMGLYRDKDDKPIIGVYEDYDVYERIADEVREHVASGKEALYFGNSEHFYTKPKKVATWFATMKNKRSHCREILCGDGPVQKEYAKRVAALGNPNFKVKHLAKPASPVATEFGVWGNKVVFFSGTGKDLFTIVVESKKMADTQRAIFEQMWSSL